MLRISACFPIDLMTGNRLSVLGNRNDWPVYITSIVYLNCADYLSSPHCGYLVPATQIASFLQAGCRVKVLLADVR